MKIKQDLMWVCLSQGSGNGELEGRVKVSDSSNDKLWLSEWFKEKIDKRWKARLVKYFIAHDGFPENAFLTVRLTGRDIAAWINAKVSPDVVSPETLILKHIRH